MQVKKLIVNKTARESERGTTEYSKIGFKKIILPETKNAWNLPKKIRLRK